MQTTAPVILLTRPAEDSEAFASALRDRLGPDVRIVISPLLSIRLATALPDTTGLAGLIFTSRNGVRAWQAMNGPALPCYCVGEATAAAARAAGMSAMVGEGDGAALARQIAGDRPTGCWLHVHGAHMRVDLAAELAPLGIAVTGFEAYAQDALPLTEEARALLSGAAPVILPVFSPRTGKMLARGETPAAPVYIVALSAAVAAAVAPLSPRNCTISTQPDADAMLAATEAQWRRAAG
ncbi:hypothetical protein ATO6_03480 [Oceanicola sp. 22II-s10i]|uniref:uroporphyrinogen-III synthase n=1 Tax=Oceanicola sp. 22II-s10i TaxID=1317116 RepID=UPI000B5220BC|nr:uroporphyrinogen-III synthase [Oceanicola sp. 22II-s10i]OWU85950.1 hypothetical protein ATO6_03480 [Oceanicola sp. 22II-s10i]